MRLKDHKTSKTLFVLCGANVGGAAASLVNLLSLYQAQGVTYDVFLMDHSGIWTEKVAKYSNLLPKDRRLWASMAAKSNLKSLKDYFFRLKFIVSYKLFGAMHARQKLYQRSARRLSKCKYTNVIAYQESQTTDFVQYIDAPNKIAWMHTDFSKFRPFAPQYATSELYACFQHVACVTKASVQSMIELLGRSPQTTHLIRNTLPVELICERAQEAICDVAKERKPFFFVSLGRLSPEKGYDRIPKVAQLLKEQGYSFDWYIIGDGSSRSDIETEIEGCGVQDTVHLLGARMNPYPYIRMADCLVITSIYEAQPMVANEALILDTPVISTEFASVREVIREGENGAIAAQDVLSLASALVHFMADEAYRVHLTEGARSFQYSNEKELELIASLLMD